LLADAFSNKSGLYILTAYLIYLIHSHVLRL
jgi:hypothetical protein